MSALLQPRLGLMLGVLLLAALTGATLNGWRVSAQTHGQLAQAQAELMAAQATLARQNLAMAKLAAKAEASAALRQQARQLATELDRQIVARQQVYQQQAARDCGEAIRQVFDAG